MSLEQYFFFGRKDDWLSREKRKTSQHSTVDIFGKNNIKTDVFTYCRELTKY